MKRRGIAIGVAAMLVITGAAPTAVSSSAPAGAAKTSDGGRTCEKRVDGKLREIDFRKKVTCRKAKRIMKRYILHRKLPGLWECRSIPQFGKCLYFELGALKPKKSFNFVPGQRA